MCWYHQPRGQRGKLVIDTRQRFGLTPAPIPTYTRNRDYRGGQAGLSVFWLIASLRLGLICAQRRLKQDLTWYYESAKFIQGVCNKNDDC